MSSEPAFICYGPSRDVFQNPLIVSQLARDYGWLLDHALLELGMRSVELQNARVIVECEHNAENCRAKCSVYVGDECRETGEKS